MFGWQIADLVAVAAVAGLGEEFALGNFRCPEVAVRFVEEIGRTAVVVLGKVRTAVDLEA